MSLATGGTVERVASGRYERTEHLDRALSFLKSIQQPSGYWEAEMVWNTMLLSQYVITRRIVAGSSEAFHQAIDGETRRLILRNYEVCQRPDGSFPMHGEGEGFVYMTTLAYVALRVLGVGKDEPMCARARWWLKAQPGGVLAIPSWGKFWLAMLGLYGWDGLNPVPPELFLLPEWVPLHPNNQYCHTRYIYLGIGYLYGRRFRAELGSLTGELREELYDLPYERIDFSRHRNSIAETDLYVRPSWLLRRSYDALVVHEHLGAPLRQVALRQCFSRILYEQRASRYQGISPVNGLLNTLAIYSFDPTHPELGRSMEAIEAWRWQDEEEGIRYTGAHSTAWDTAFVLRAMIASPGRARSPSKEAMHRAYAWLKATQMQEELPGYEAERREPILGGWCFSDGQHRWPVSDCTAEALAAILELRKHGLEPEGDEQDPKGPFSARRIEQAVEFILRRQNADGGFGSYEARRAGGLLELINPSEMYGNCMTERSYTECTASCLGALARYRELVKDAPAPLARRVDRALEEGTRLLRSRQLEDGAYAGFWGVNYTYGIFHVVEALRAVGVPPSDPAIARALDWLRAHQKSDGGWGEHWTSCVEERYVEHPESQAAMTAWALLALMEDEPRDPCVARGIACLERLQEESGAWPRQAQAGVFFSTALLDYRLYKDVFPTWALGRHASFGG